MKKMKQILIIFLSVVSLILNSQVTTIASGNWSNSAIWSGGSVPGNNKDVIINHTVTITSAASIRTLTINGKLINNSQLSIRGGLNNNGTYIDNLGTIRFRTTKTHNVNGVIWTTNLIVNNNSTVTFNSKFYVKGITNIDGTLNSNGNLILYSDVNGRGSLGSMNGVINGNFTSQIWVDRCNDWSYYSNPFNVSFDQLNDSSNSRMIYTGFPGSNFPSFSFTNTYKYTTNVGYVTPSNVSDIVNRGTGYTYWNSNVTFGTSSPSIPQNWKISTTGSINFNSSFVYGLTWTPSDAFNLVGNPYPGTIDWSNNTWTRSNISTTIYLWNTCNQNWTTFNSTNGVGTNGGTRYISPYQGFFILASNSSPALSAPKSVIVDNVSTLLRTSSTLPMNSLLISTNRDEMIISMDSLATDDFDYDYDAVLVDTSNFLYSLDSVSKYIVNAISYKESGSVDISVKNSDTIKFSNVSSFIYHKIYLYDSVNNTKELLTDGYVKSFSVNGQNETRYKIVFEKELNPVGITKNTIILKDKKLVRSIDILGREVSENQQGLVIYMYDDGSCRKVINN